MALRQSQIKRAKQLLKILEFQPMVFAAGVLVQAAARRPELAEASLANECVRGRLAEQPDLYSEAGERACPTVRAEFEHATVIGKAGESIAIGIRKNWGAFLGFEPLRADDPVHPFYVLYIFKASSPYNRRVLQRKGMKRRLPKPARKWVNIALRSTRRDFLASLPAGVAATILRSLRLEPIAFWRAAKGKTDLGLPAPAVQLTMFDRPQDVAVKRWGK